MSRRRRSGNKLLGRILLISLAAHAIALPILAHFGAFEKIKEHFMTATVVVPPPIPEKEKPIVKKAEKKAVAKAKTSQSEASKSAHAAKSNLSQPKVLASNVGPGTGDAGPAVNPNGTGKAGVVPTPSAPASSENGTGNGPGTGETSQPKPETQPKAQPVATPAPSPEPTPVPKPHVPIYAGAEPISQPQPEIPDDLRSEALDKTTTVLLTVGADGSVTDASVTQSSGNGDLDRLAVQAAKRWKFNPATKDGEPVSSHIRLHVQFKVD